MAEYIPREWPVESTMERVLQERLRERIANKVAADLVNHPPHYKTGGIETIDFIEAKQLPYHLGNVVKYVTRAQHKGNTLEDLKKAQWYLNRYIQIMEPADPKHAYGPSYEAAGGAQ